jgi:hypothetical protein
VYAKLEKLPLCSDLTLFVINILAASNPGSGSSDKTHYDTEYKYLNQTTMEGGINELREESSRSNRGGLLWR